jgi:hypothetical protein|tara:strand:- start:859 stop:1602 length:744 start_codon:yes stop_codon:yes gene_type:complete
MAITKKRALQIVADLLQKYPKGPRGRKGYKKEDYILRHQYCEDVDAYRSLPQLVCGTDYFGYSKKDLLELSTFKFGEDQDGNFATDEWDWRMAIRSIYPELRYSSKAVTSRGRRLSRRIGTPVNKLVRSGTLAGCYRIQFGWGSDGGSVVAYGNTADDAQTVAELMCGHAFPNERVRSTQLISMKDVGAITTINKRTVDSMEADIQTQLKKIKDLRDRIEKTEAKQAVIRMFATQQVGAMAVALCEE